MERAEIRPDGETYSRENGVFGWTATFLLIALIAAALGFGGVDGATVKVARFIFVGALVAFTISAIAGFLERPPKR
jgi:uncharacterized membrane protein YtjA (UPF0391 family)